MIHIANGSGTFSCHIMLFVYIFILLLGDEKREIVSGR